MNPSACSLHRIRCLIAQFAAALALCFLLAGCPVAFNIILSKADIIGAPCAVAVDAQGNRYVAGIFASADLSTDFDTSADTFIIESSRHLFVTRYNANGSYAWTQIFGEKRIHPFAAPVPRAIVVRNGRVYVAGSASGENAFREDELPRFASRLGSQDAFVFALDAATGDPDAAFNGNGVVRFGGAGADEAAALALSPDGATLYVGGAVRGSANVSLPLPGGGGYIPPPGSIGFVMALDAVAATPRAFGLDTDGSAVRDGVNAVAGEVAALLASGTRLYALGDFAPFNEHDASVLALDAATGDTDAGFNGGRITLSSATGRAFGRGLAISGDGLFLYATGMFDGENLFLSTIGPFTAVVEGLDRDDFDTFVFCVDAQTGQPRQGFGADTTGDAVGDGLAVFSQGSFVIPTGIVSRGNSSASGALFVSVNRPAFFRDGKKFATGDMFVMRLTADTGALEPSFAGSGILAFGRSSGEFAHGIAIAGNVLLVAGFADSDGASDCSITTGTKRKAGFLREVDTTDGIDLSRPRISSLDPSYLDSGGPAFMLTVGCTGIAGSSEVLWNGEPRPTVFVDARTLRATISAADTATPGTLGRVSIRNPDSDAIDMNDVISEEAIVEIGRSGLSADIARLIPPSRPAGSGAFRLAIEAEMRSGAGFDPGARVLWNDEFRPTTVVSRTRVEADIPATDVAEPGAASVEVQNPGSSGRGGTFVIGAPMIDSISPTSAPAGTPGLPLIIDGSRFAADVEVLWNGQPRALRSQSGSRLVAAIPAGDLAAAGQAFVTARNPGSGADVMRRTFTVTTPAGPVINGLEPASKPGATGDFTLAVRGTAFSAGDAVRWDGQPRPTAFISATQLEAQIPNSDLMNALAATVAEITVASSDGDISNAIQFPLGVPDLFEIEPSSVAAGSPGFTGVIAGSRLAIDSVAMVNGQPRETRFIPKFPGPDFNRLLVTIPASDVAQDGVAEISVLNPGTGISDTLTLTIGAGAPAEAPVFIEMAPSSFNPDGAGNQLVIIGQNLDAAAELLWNDVPLARDPNNPATFLYQIPLALITAADQADGTAQLRMRNPDGQVSNARTFVINPPVLEQLNPTSAPGDSDVPFTVTGRRFSVRAWVLFDSQQLITTYVSATQLTATIPASMLAGRETALISVQNPSRLAISNTLPFTIGGPSAPATAATRSVRRREQTIYVRDRDGDGWIDDLERLLGSSPESAASTPPGFREPVRINAFEPLAPRLKTQRTSRGRLLFSGVLPVAEDFTARGSTVYVYAGDKLRAFKLNSPGASQSLRRESFRVSAAPRRTSGPLGSAPFVLRLDAKRAPDDLFVLFGGTLYHWRAP